MIVETTIWAMMSAGEQFAFGVTALGCLVVALVLPMADRLIDRKGRG